MMEYYETMYYYITEKYVLIDTCVLIRVIFILIICKLYQEFEIFSWLMKNIFSGKNYENFYFYKSKNFRTCFIN